MAFRALITACWGLLFLFACCGPTDACFGPKLYIGTSEGPEADVMFALVTLYVQEKTGVESIRVVLTAQQDPIAELGADRLDLAFSVSAKTGDPLLELEGYPVLLAGERPLSDLQFTTVLPAIRKLNGLLTNEAVSRLVGRVRAGESAMAVVRAFFQERRWI